MRISRLTTVFFTSPFYWFFLPTVYFIFYAVPERLRWGILLAAGLIFYTSLNSPALLFILSLVIGITYICGIQLENSPDARRKTLLFRTGIILNLSILIFVKYFSEIAGWVIQRFHVTVSENPTLLSIGVSYYVFQALSYLIDVYLEVEKPERHFGYFALYLSFFPKLLQGPIERAGDLLPQLQQKYVFQYENMRTGMFFFLWGLFKKVVIADQLAPLVNRVYGDVNAYSGFPLLLSSYFYAVQLYCDFSGYTDMALGSARIFNIHLTQNFNCPYFAVSIADFWRRWHISFSRWILDYLFKPLQLQWRNGGKWGTAAALLITFFLSGLWHGVGWGFAVWGLLHGCYLAASVFYQPIQKRIHKKIGLYKTKILQIWQIGITFHLVCIAWIFFRAASLADAGYILTHWFPLFPDGKWLFIYDTKTDTRCGILILVFILTEWLQKKRPIWITMQSLPVWVRWGVYYALLLLILYYSNNRQEHFIYVQF